VLRSELYLKLYGPLAFGCGPSGQEKSLEKEEASFDQTLQTDYSQTFAQNQQILSNLNSVLQPIVNAGPNQQGFSPEELSTLNTQATEGNAQGYNQAVEAAAQQENTQGGGTTLLPSGVNAQINAGIASAAEGNLANEKLGITQANYAQGQQNWETALSGEESVAAGEAPLGYASATTSANSAAFNEANIIGQENNQEFGQIVGGIAGIGGAVLGGLGNLDTTGGSTGGEQVMNFLSGL
jgi:hypothetical protein